VIVIDSSALVAILDDEPERIAFAAIIAGTDRCLVSAVNAHETGLVMFGRHKAQGLSDLWDLLGWIHAEIVPFDEPQVRSALDAFTRYGKGIDARARLNLCDCAAYALAKSRNLPLLFKGDDFRATDVVACV
jgi:ribonuclease VapC